MDEQIPLFEIAWDESDIANVVESISRGSYWAKGPFVERFEQKISEYLDVEHAITVNSGTTALIAALNALEIGQGDEVIVPSFTFVATANAVKFVGAEPVFADIETETYGLDPESVTRNISARTEAIIPVHLYGQPCEIEEIHKIAEENNLRIVEDAAEAFGATSHDTHVGTVGDIGALSFCQNKIVVTGEGGAVITDNDELAAKLRLYRSHGRATEEYFESAKSGEYVRLGTNVRMSDLTAALGCAQIDKVDTLISERQRAAQYMNNKLSAVEGVNPPQPQSGVTHVYQLYTVELDPEINRRTIIQALEEEGVASKVYWDTAVHQTAYYSKNENYANLSLPCTEQTTERILSLPMYPDLSTVQLDRIVESLEAGVKQAKS